MLDKIILWLCNVLLPKPSPRDIRIRKGIESAAERLAKYGGRFTISKNGVLEREFDTKEGEQAFWRDALGKQAKAIDKIFNNQGEKLCQKK